MVNTLEAIKRYFGLKNALEERILVVDSFHKTQAKSIEKLFAEGETDKPIRVDTVSSVTQIPKKYFSFKHFGKYALSNYDLVITSLRVSANKHFSYLESENKKKIVDTFTATGYQVMRDAKDQQVPVLVLTRDNHDGSEKDSGLNAVIKAVAAVYVKVDPDEHRGGYNAHTHIALITSHTFTRNSHESFRSDSSTWKKAYLMMKKCMAQRNAIRSVSTTIPEYDEITEKPTFNAVRKLVYGTLSFDERHIARKYLTEFKDIFKYVK